MKIQKTFEIGSTSSDMAFGLLYEINVYLCRDEKCSTND